MADHNTASTLTIPQLQGSQKYHAFIAHSTDDRTFADELTTKLEDMGFNCFMYERDLPPDRSIIQGVSTNIKISRRVILVVTKSFIASRWSVFEAMEAMSKGYSEDRMVLIPVLYDTPTSQIPHYLRNYICLEQNEEHFWTRLFSALVDDRPSTVLIPAGNVAVGLAWTYFYGFLKLFLPGMRTRVDEFVAKQNVTTEVLKKMVIIIASSCNCPKTLIELAPDCMSIEGCLEFKASRAGTERSYRSTVYRVKDPENNKEYLFIAEFATPLLSLWEMEVDGLAGLSKEQKKHQRMLFADKVEEILSHPDNRACCNMATLMEYNDETEESRGGFLKLLCQHIRREVQKEKDIQDQIDEMQSGYRQMLVSQLGGAETPGDENPGGNSTRL